MEALLLTPQSYEKQARRDPLEVAEEKQLVPFVADDMTLQLDIDDPDLFDETVVTILEEAGVFDRGEGLVTRSPGGNQHVYIKLKQPLPLETRIALQACLGSDPRREVLSLLRKIGPAEYQKPTPLVLYETEHTAAHVRAWQNGEPDPHAQELE